MNGKNDGAAVTQSDRRRNARHNIYIPIELEGYDKHGERVVESTVVINTSPGTAFFLSGNEFKTGSELIITVRPTVEGVRRRNFTSAVVRLDRDIHGFSGAKSFGVTISLAEKVDLYEEYKDLFYRNGG